MTRGTRNNNSVFFNSKMCVCVYVGVAVRQCNMNGVWSDMIDISQCASESFLNLQYMAVSYPNIVSTMLFDG